MSSRHRLSAARRGADAVTQQINLYQPGLRRERNVFSGAAMLQVAGVVLGGLLAMYGYAIWQVKGLDLERSNLVDQRDDVTKRVEQLSQKYPPKKQSKLLEQEIARLTAERDQSRRLIDILAGRTLGDTKGFGDHLEALARRHVRGTWLTEVTIGEGGQTVDLLGTALSPDLVPVYIQRLSDESVFRGLAFNMMTLQQASEEPSRVDFTLRTKVPEE